VPVRAREIIRHRQEPGKEIECACKERHFLGIDHNPSKFSIATALRAAVGLLKNICHFSTVHEQELLETGSEK